MLQSLLTGTSGFLGYCQSLVTTTVIIMMTMTIGITPFWCLAYTVARTVLRPAHAGPYLILRMILEHRDDCYPSVAQEETDAWRE